MFFSAIFRSGNNFCDFLYHGGESRDLFWLFCICSQTERVRKLLITSFILNKFPCSKHGKAQDLVFVKY